MTQAPPTEQPHKLLAMSAALRAATQRPRGGSKERVTHQQWVTNGCRICDILMHYSKGHAMTYVNTAIQEWIYSVYIININSDKGVV